MTSNTCTHTHPIVVDKGSYMGERVNVKSTGAGESDAIPGSIIIGLCFPHRFTHDFLFKAL